MPIYCLSTITSLSILMILGPFLPRTLAAERELIRAGVAFDYPSMAFYPERWEKRGLDVPMIPWKGKQITFVTSDEKLNARVMTDFISHLDEGWNLYRELTGSTPRPFKTYESQPIIAATPAGGLTCGYGCGYVGATGIEMTHFYDHHYPALQKDARRVPHAYFYEMGRNYYTFGQRHSCFVTGFAVFMRYVCMDTLELVDRDEKTRKTIDQAIDLYQESELGFVEAFTTFTGRGEKGNRLKDKEGREIVPTDQNVMYASLMLRLRRDYGGNDWVKEFFKQLKTLQPERPKDEASALRQCISTLVCASLAADRDLTPLFVEDYRLPLEAKVRRILAEVDWGHAETRAGDVLKKLPSAWQQGGS